MVLEGVASPEGLIPPIFSMAEGLEEFRGVGAEPVTSAIMGQFGDSQLFATGAAGGGSLVESGLAGHLSEAQIVAAGAAAAVTGGGAE